MRYGRLSQDQLDDALRKKIPVTVHTRRDMYESRLKYYRLMSVRVQYKEVVNSCIRPTIRKTQALKLSTISRNRLLNIAIDQRSLRISRPSSIRKRRTTGQDYDRV